MKGKINDEVRLQHIAECIEEIEKAIAGLGFISFNEHHVIRIAVLKWIEIIGEAANYMSEETKHKYANVEWKKIIGLRNIIVHEYFGVNYEIIWEIATIFVPHLKKELTTINLDLKDNFLTN